MKILHSWSSGKDSAWALHLLNAAHPGTVGALLTTINEAVDRVAMHGVRRRVLEAQAHATGLPLRIVPLPSPCTDEVYAQRMRHAIEAAAADGFTHASFGDLFLADVRRYREERLSGCGIDPLFPLWNAPTARLARDMIDGGLRAKVACVDTRVLDDAFVGRDFDEALLRELPAHVDPCGENGEFHTCVYAGPMFRAPLHLDPGARVTRDSFTWIDFTARDGA